MSVVVGEDLGDDLAGEVAKRLLAGGLLLQAEAKRDLSRSNPAPHANPAPPGQFPRGRTWNLRDGVVVDPAAVDAVRRTMRVRVGLLGGAWYGEALRRRGWLGIPDTARRIAGRLKALLGGAGRVEVGG